jgi:hypothetical protein
VYRKLLASSTKGQKLKARFHDVVVRGENGAPLFRIRHQRNSVALLLPVENVAEPTMREISKAVARILQAANAQTSDSTGNDQSNPKGARPFRGSHKRDHAAPA